MSPSIGDTSRRDLVGLKGRSKIIWASCPDCGLERWVPLNRPDILCRKCCGKLHHEQNQPHLAEHRDGCACMKCRISRGELVRENNPSWNGGIRNNVANGYVAVLLPDDHPMAEMTWTTDSYVLEHRLVMAEYLGRPLKSYEYVHHINGLKDDNRIENLELWIQPHPSGIRLLDYADEIMKHVTLSERRTQ